jgi:hypothetical protein
MQKILYTIALVMAIALSGQAQNHTRDNNNQNNMPPPAVQQTFQKEHPTAKDVNWQRTNHQWHSRHTDETNNTHVDTYYNQNGNRVDSHQPIERNAVPHEVDQHVQDRYHADDYTAIRIDRPNHPFVFQLDVRQKKKHRKVYVDQRGHEVNYNDRH